ncbi:MAG: class I SAM-dependent methyltransferase [Gammaproteobacteria bacterium]
MVDRSVERAWTHYWQSDRLASCGGAGERQYQPAIVRHWHRVFAAFATPPHLLDLCCGNGALAILAGRYFWERRSVAAEIDAVDRAPIDPARWLARHRAWVSKIRFHGGMAAESLAFPNGTFTAVIGQYALEYTDLDRTLAECVRVLAPRGHLAFVLHAREGIVVKQAIAQQAEIAHIRALDYFSLARDLARASGGKAPQFELSHLRQTFNVRSDQLKGLAQQSREPEMYANIMGVVEHALGHVSDCPVELVVAKITEVEDGLHYHALRTEALAHAALDAEGIRQHLAPLIRQGFRPIGEYPSALEGPVELLGWGVVLTRFEPNKRE